MRIIEVMEFLLSISVAMLGYLVFSLVLSNAVVAQTQVRSHLIDLFYYYSACQLERRLFVAAPFHWPVIDCIRIFSIPIKCG